VFFLASQLEQIYLGTRANVRGEREGKIKSPRTLSDGEGMGIWTIAVCWGQGGGEALGCGA